MGFISTFPSLPCALQVKLGERIDVPVFEMGTDAKPDEIAAQGVAKAKKVLLRGNEA